MLDDGISIDKQELENLLLDGKSKLPKSPFGKRIIPNDLARSSLFTVVNQNVKREYFKERELATFGQTKITYRGEELRQDDQDVWLQLIYIASRNRSCEIEFSPYKVLEELHWPKRTQYRDKLKDSISRMSATDTKINNAHLEKGFSLSLVRKFFWKDENEKNLSTWKVFLEPELFLLFGEFHYSKIIWEQRRKLNPLAKWLHSYYCSHAEPYPLKIKTIHHACGSKTKQMKHFKPVLRDALIELVQVNFLETFWIMPDNKVSVMRKKNEKGLLDGQL